MALKRKITKAEFEKLSKDLQGEYNADGDNYLLDTDDADDADELRRARDREKENAKKSKKEAAELRSRLEELEGSDDRKRGDIEKIDNSWKEKVAKLEKETGEKLSAKDQYIKKTLINGVAEAMAARISNAPKLMARAIAERLTVNFDGDEPTVEIVGDDGKVINSNLDKLEKEFVANKEYASIIVASKASGGGAPRNGSERQTGGSAPASEKADDLSKMKPKDLVSVLEGRIQEAKQ